MKLYEKTLELNIGAEILNLLRTTYPKSYISSIPPQIESSLGYDEEVKHWNSFLLQYKKAKEDEPWYTFIINKKQHKDMLEVIKNQKKCAFYVLPLYNSSSEKEISKISPNLLIDTLFIDVVWLDEFIKDRTNGQIKIKVIFLEHKKISILMEGNRIYDDVPLKQEVILGRYIINDHSNFIKLFEGIDKNLIEETINNLLKRSNRESKEFDESTSIINFPYYSKKLHITNNRR